MFPEQNQADYSPDHAKGGGFGRGRGVVVWGRGWGPEDSVRVMDWSAQGTGCGPQGHGPGAGVRVPYGGSAA